MVTKRIIPFFLLGLVVLSEPLLSGPPPFCYEEQDGSPAGCFKKLKFPNGNVTDNGDGSFSIADNTSVGGGNSVYLEEGDVAKLNNSSADLTLDFNGTDFDTSVAGAELDLTIAAGVTRDTEWDTEAEVQTAWGSVDILLKTEGDSYYQPLEATLTDIADGTIVEDLVNTANPWADNEVADTITASNYLPLAGGTLTGEVVVDDLGLEFTAGDALSDCSSFSATGGGIFYDDSEGKFKKCQDNTLTDLDTGGAGTIDGSGTTNEITYWVDADTLGSLAVATYPSLTELSYVKGVTSAIQTQINGKLASADIDTYSELNAIVADVTLTHNGLIDTYSELNAIVADQTLTHNGLIDTFAELDAIVADKALLNKADGGVITGSWDMGGASVEIPNSTSLPGTCTVGQIYMDTDATTGQRIYACESTNTWALQGDGGGGGSDTNAVKEYVWPASATLPLEAADSIPPIAKDTGTNVDQLVVDFDSGTDECREVSFKVPSDVASGSTITFRAVWYSTATTGSVVWDFRHTSGDTEGETWDDTLTTESAASDAVQGTTKQVTVTTWTETLTNLGWAANDIVTGVFCRDGNGTAGTDDLAADARAILFGMEIPRA